MSKELTHIDEAGNARMVDVADKASTVREAVAEGIIYLSEEAYLAITEGRVKKGDVLAVAQLAGIQGAKRTADLVPLCHPIPIDGVSVDLEARDGVILATATVRTTWKTGVEMEAITAVMTALLTVYDMAKAIDKGMHIDGVRLVSKTGGRADYHAIETS